MKYTAFILTIVDTLVTAESLPNIAKNGTASQSSVYNWNGLLLTADLAITGEPTNDFFSLSCATTGANKYEAWWMLKFPVDTIFVNSVKIYYRSDILSRFALFSLYISNVSISSQIPTDNDLCYKHTGPGLPSMTESRDCNALGRNVIIYNKRTVDTPSEYDAHAWLHLCDVQVYGCYKGWSGNDCSIPCPGVCIDKHCFPNNRTCIWGRLHNNCLRDERDYTDVCVEGCKPGSAGKFCNKYNLASNKHTVLMPAGNNQNTTFAVDGDKTNKSCIKTSGVSSWLQVDLMELNVITSVYLSYENDNIVKIRSEGHSIYITNTSGLWTDDSRLSLNTSNNFPYIMYDISPVIGQYVIYVPVATNGFAHTDICEVEIIGCPAGKYGEECNKPCPVNSIGFCHPETGDSIFGCKDGWQGVECDNPCASPYFGNSCKQVCNCLNNAPCNNVNGTCPRGGCQKGWEGQSCSIALSQKTEISLNDFIYAVVGTFILTVVSCVAIFLLVIWRLRRQYKNHILTTNLKQYENQAISSHNKGTNYEKNIPVFDDHPYDIIG